MSQIAVLAGTAEIAELRPSNADGPLPGPPDAAGLDTLVAAWMVEGRAPPPEAVATVRAFSALMEVRGLITFDHLVVGAVSALESDAGLRHWWQSRFSHLCVDEFQDVDAAQLRLVCLLAAPEDKQLVMMISRGSDHAHTPQTAYPRLEAKRAA